jgi:putative ABC transport system ATP-binding protein
MRVFEQLAANGQTVIMVTHEQDIAAHARRVIVLRDGLVASDDDRGVGAA